MRNLIVALIYTALAATANADNSALEALKQGDMRKLRFHAVAEDVPAVPFMLEDGSNTTMEHYVGKIVVLNFWATWCAPCRKEMPHLSELQTEFGGDDFTVVTIATGRNEPAKMAAFFDDIGVDNLPLHRDPKQTFARAMGVLGLPITVILGKDGDEIARLQGDADWSGDSAKAIIAKLLAE